MKKQKPTTLNKEEVEFTYSELLRYQYPTLDKYEIYHSVMQ